MTNDIQKAISTNDIKNGTLVVTTSWTGKYSTYNQYVNNAPSLTNIQSKFDARFDDPSYYYGNGVKGS